MITNAKKMSCGSCGERNYKLYSIDSGIAAECQGCKEVSLIQMVPGEIKVEGSEGSMGCLAIFDGNETA